MTNVHERAAAANVVLPQNLTNVSLNQASWGGSGLAMAASPDMIRRTGPQFWNPPASIPPTGGFNGGLSGMGGIVSQLLSIIQQLLSMVGMGGAFNGLFGNPQSQQQYFQSANASSTGDPHLAFNGTNAGGSNQQSHFDSMIGHSDLLDSDSFAGGYKVSTAVTQPGANGVTYNQQATVTTGFGGTQVSLDRNGNATIAQNGQTISLANGQSVFLGNGETVTRNADGSLVVRDDNGTGGTIATTLTENGQGVDVNTQASNVDLGGDLVNQQMQPAPIAQPILRRYLA
jgi:hypothetical protein